MIATHQSGRNTAIEVGLGLHRGSRGRDELEVRGGLRVGGRHLEGSQLRGVREGKGEFKGGK